MKYRELLPDGARIFESRLRVQWADVDIAGMMYFAAYWRFAEHAEMDLFRDLGFPYERIFDTYDIWLPRVHANADYHAPARMDDWLRTRTHIDKVGASSVRWTTVIFNERTGDAGAVMRLVVACINRQTERTRPLPEQMRSALVACVGGP